MKSGKCLANIFLHYVADFFVALSIRSLVIAREVELKL